MYSKKVFVVIGLLTALNLVFADQGFGPGSPAESDLFTSADGSCGIYPITGGNSNIQTLLLLDSMYMRMVDYYGIGPSTDYIAKTGDYLIVDAHHGFEAYQIEPDKMAPRLAATHNDVPYEITGLAANGNYLYACRRGDGIYTYDISDINNWQLVNKYQMPDTTKSVMNCMIVNDVLCFFMIKDDLYEPDSFFQLVVCSLDDPARPARISSLDVDKPIYIPSLYPKVSGDSIILGSRSGLITIIDLSNPSDPCVAGRCNLIDAADTLTLLVTFYPDEKGHLFASFEQTIQGGSRIFKSFDVSDFSNPVLLDYWNSICPSRIFPLGNGDTLLLTYAYESPEGTEHWFFDVSDPADLKSICPWQVEDELSLGWGFYDDGRFYFANTRYGVSVVDFGYSLSNPLAAVGEAVGARAILGMSNIDHDQFFTNAWSIPKGDDKIRMSILGDGKIEPVEVFEPYYQWGGYDMFLIDDLFGDIQSNYMVLYDVSQQDNPSYKGTVDLVIEPEEWFFGATRLHPDGDLVYVSQGCPGVSLVGDPGGTAVVDISNPANPVKLAQTYLSGRCSDVEERDSIVYVTGFPEENKSTGYLEVYRFTGDSLEQLSHVDLLHPGLGLELVGNLLYLTRVLGFEIYDVSDPAAPVQLCNIATQDGRNDDVVVFEELDRAFVTNDYVLMAFDVSDPTDPQLVGHYTIPWVWGWFGWRQRLRTDGHYLYWGTVSYGICVVEPYGPAIGVEDDDPVSVVTPDMELEISSIGRSLQIHYSLPRSAHIEITAYDAAGRRVAIIYQGSAEPGTHQLTWSALQLPAGVYIVRLESEGNAVSRKTIILD